MTNSEMVKQVDRLIDLADQLEIVDHTPGKIHLRIKFKGLWPAMNMDLEALQASVRGILGAQADVSKRSVVIHYDEKALPRELWELWIRSHASPKIQQLVRRELLSRLSAG